MILNKISNIDMLKDDMVQLEEQPIRRSHEMDLEQRLNRELLINNRDRAWVNSPYADKLSQLVNL